MLSRQRRDSDQDTPAIDFKYEDTDSYLNELSELYSYTEVSEFQTTMDLFQSSLESVLGSKDWEKLSKARKKDFIMIMLDRFEVGVQYVWLQERGDCLFHQLWNTQSLL